MASSAHENFIQGLRDSFEIAGYKNKDLNEIIINQLNAYHQQVQDLLELEETIQALSNEIKILKAKSK